MENKEKAKETQEIIENKEAANLLNMIIAKTYSRHSQMTEEEFLKDIGFENSGKTEQEAIRVSIFNLMVEMTRAMFAVKEEFNMAKNILKVCLDDKKGE